VTLHANSIAEAVNKNKFESLETDENGNGQCQLQCLLPVN